MNQFFWQWRSLHLTLQAILIFEELLPLQTSFVRPVGELFLEKIGRKKSYFNVKWSLYRCVTISLFKLFRNAPRNLFETCCIAFWLKATARLKCEICYNWSIHDELILYDSLFGSFFGWSSAIFLTKFSQSPFYYSKEISLKIERCE